MNRNLFLFMLFGGPFLIGLFVLLVGHFFQVQWFDSKAHMFLLICVYVPTLTILRSRFLRIPFKDFMFSLIPLFGWKRHLDLFRKP